MSKSKNGGQAFPRAGFSGPRGFGTPELGMTLRDWFAGQALAGMCAFHGTYGEGNGPGNNAARAYEQADAMLAAREGGDA